ncbi:MAG: Crp/Fnr family transcriptional regulator [Desulfitobacteriaceae bacterium]
MNDYRPYCINYQYREKLLKAFSLSGTRLSFSARVLVESGYRKLNYVCIILSGRVKQYFIDPEGAKRTILILSRGDIFGEITLLQDDFDWVLTETLESTEVLRIDGETFFTVLKTDPDVGKELLRMVSTKFRILMAEIHDMTFYSTRERLAELLKRLSKQHGIRTEQGVEINLKLTHEEIAAMIGSSRATVTRMLEDLEQEGFIKRRGKHLILLTSS